MTADVNVTEKVARAREFWWAAHLMGKRSHRNARRSSFDAGFDAALAALSDPEVLAGIAGVLREHTWISLYSSRERTAECACGVTLPYTPESDDEFEEAIERAFRDHQAAALAAWLRGQE